MTSIDYVFKTVKYGNRVVNLTASVHLPENAGSFMGIALYFHGGGYVVGSRAMLPPAHIQALNQAGLVAVSSDYRLCPTISALDGRVADSMAAYKWARNELPALLEKEHDIRVNGEDIVTLGHSCGGGLALLMASTDSPPKAILDLLGFNYLRDSFYHNPQNCSRLTLFPPTFIVQGTADVVVHPKFAQWAHAELQKNGVPTELYLVEGAAHGFDAELKGDDAAFEPIQKGVNFLAQHVGK